MTLGREFGHRPESNCATRFGIGGTRSSRNAELSSGVGWKVHSNRGRRGDETLISEEFAAVGDWKSEPLDVARYA